MAVRGVFRSCARPSSMAARSSSFRRAASADAALSIARARSRPMAIRLAMASTTVNVAPVSPADRQAAYRLSAQMHRRNRVPADRIVERDAGLDDRAQLGVTQLFSMPVGLRTGRVVERHLFHLEDAGDVGDGVGQDAVEAVVEQDGAAERVQLFGFAPRVAAPRSFAAAPGR